MKKLAAFTLLGILVVALLCLGKSETLTNRTGETASAVVITFSESVRISGYDESTFPDQSPAGLAGQFTFSGGTLPNGGRFRISWSPSSAEIVEYEWRMTPTAAANETSYRGVNINPELIQKGDIEILATEWKANLVRICLFSANCGLCGTTDTDTACHSLDLEKLDSVIDWCEEYGVRAVIVLHHFTGYNPHTTPGDYRLWNSPALQQALVDFWEALATRYAGRGDVIYGYDLLNEPRTEDRKTPSIWNYLVARIVLVIRRVDTRHSIVVECGYGLPENFRSLAPLEDPNIIYSFHFGEPYTFTNQHYKGLPAGGRYPSTGVNKEYVRSLVTPAYEFAQRYGVRVYVGELIVYCSADSASRSAYIRDCLDLFEEYGFDYTFWAYRSWPQASLEHVGYEAPTKWIEEFVGETEALTVFKQFLSRNKVAGAPSPPAVKASCLFDTTHWIPDRDYHIRTLNLAWRMTGVCDVTYQSVGLLTEEVLAGADLLVTGGTYGTPYSSSEARAIANFVERGGALLFYGTRDFGSNLVLGRFGIQINTAQILSPEPVPYGEDPRTFFVRSFAGPLQVAEGLVLFPINCGTSLAISSPALAIASTDSGTWRDVNRNLSRDSGEEKGPFAVIGVSKYGSGRVAVVADDEFRDLCTWPAYAALICWLLQCAN